MPTLPVIVGAIGGLLVLVGLVGGGFEFSGSVMPRVKGFSRILCFGTGGVMLVIAIGMGVLEMESRTQPDRTVADSSTLAEPRGDAGGIGRATTQADSTAGSATTGTAVGFVMTSPGHEAYVFELPDPSSNVVTALADGAPVEIVCTAQGSSVTSPVTGLTSSLWNGTTDGGFVPDVMVDTGTDQPTMPNCLG